MSNVTLFCLLEFCDTSICLLFMVPHLSLFLPLNLWLLSYLFQNLQDAFLTLVSCLVPCVVASKWKKCCKASVLMQNSNSPFYIWESYFMQLSKLFKVVWNRKGIVKIGYFSRTDAKLPISNTSSYKKWLKCSCSGVITVTTDAGILRHAKRKIHNTWNSSH